MQKLVFISNIKIPEAKVDDYSFGNPIPTGENLFDVNELKVDASSNIKIDTSGNTVYVIDVHCIFQYGKDKNKKQLKLQEQGGVIIYRHLLTRFKDCQDKLRVIFYSPIHRDDLVKLKPENYVLRLLPFVQCKYDGQFPSDLKLLLDANSYLQFNNASENLLSGWAIAGANKIDLRGKKVLIIDDEWQQWKIVYNEILNCSIEYFLSSVCDIKTEFKKLNNNTFTHLPLGSLKKYDFIISDLYLWEQHETELWKTEDFINSISGFLLFKKIRIIEPAIPVIFHTTSTKFRIFEALFALSSDGQIPKNIHPKASKFEKQDNYKLLAGKISKVTTSYSDCWLNDFYRYIINEHKTKNDWWTNSTELKEQSVLKEFKDIIKHCIVSYKRFKFYDEQFFEVYFIGREINPISLSASEIISSFGKLKELSKAGYNPEIQFSEELRNQAAHGRNFHLFNMDDVKIIASLIEKTLRENRSRKIGFGETFKEPQHSKNKYAHQIFYYIHYYNTWYNYIPEPIKSIFKKRINDLMGKYSSECWRSYTQKERKYVIDSTPFFEIDNAIHTQWLPKFDNNKVLMKFKTL